MQILSHCRNKIQRADDINDINAVVSGVGKVLAIVVDPLCDRIDQRQDHTDIHGCFIQKTVFFQYQNRIILKSS